jgi:hypothetical protein
MTSDDFDGGREPMRALRDLISVCEGLFSTDPGEQALLSRAQDGFTALRALFGDTRPADRIEETAAMPEPHFGTLALTAAALQCAAKLLPAGETHAIRFTGRWAGYAPRTVSEILDLADQALGNGRETELVPPGPQ